ncbi:MAG: alpha/beta fold hydrolase, partial [Rhodospirillum sp.]|nr:alpha/beta fold hydrolase [Rhodospirillum sp.]
MADAILVPQVGQDLTEAKIVELHVKEGDTVKKGDMVAVVESEKASFEVEAFVEGVVISLPFQVGDWATVLEPLMHLGQPGETLVAGPPAEPKAAKPPRPAAPEPARERTVVPLAVDPAKAVSKKTSLTVVPAAGGARVVRSSPVARVRAAAHGLDLAAIEGTGPDGAVVLRDVDSVLVTGGTGVLSTPSAWGGADLETRILRQGEGVPILFIHGFGADLSSWRPMVGALGIGCPLLALDLPGHGGSRGHGAAEFHALVEAVGRAAAAAGRDGIHLVGHSLGAAIAAALTERGDLDTRSLTLLSPAGLGPSIDGAFVDGFLAARSEAALAAWMRRLVHDPASLRGALVRATLAAREDGGLGEAQKRVARGVFEGSTQLFSIREALARLGVPCSVIVGR